VLWGVQTPQVFRRQALERALQREDLLEMATDEAWLVEQQGGEVRVIDSEEHNFKVTTERDLELAELLLSLR
jgi:2-C-methyl-D-erythritol 4-phosphate cytidylyltransferase